MIHSYSKVFNVGHEEVSDILKHPVVVQEKLDGSQLSFRVVDGALFIRSKGAVIDPENPADLFAPAVRWILNNQSELVPGWTYRAEAISKPKHNTLVYSRAPESGFVLFDVDEALESMVKSYELGDEIG